MSLVIVYIFMQIYRLFNFHVSYIKLILTIGNMKNKISVPGQHNLSPVDLKIESLLANLSISLHFHLHAWSHTISSCSVSGQEAEGQHCETIDSLSLSNLDIPPFLNANTLMFGGSWAYGLSTARPELEFKDYSLLSVHRKKKRLVSLPQGSWSSEPRCLIETEMAVSFNATLH